MHGVYVTKFLVQRHGGLYYTHLLNIIPTSQISATSIPHERARDPSEGIRMRVAGLLGHLHMRHFLLGRELSRS